MGTNYECGCRSSMGSWYLCGTHELELVNKIEVVGLDDG